MKLGKEVGLGQGHIVIMGTQLPLQKEAQPPIFGTCPLWPYTSGWIKMPLGREVDLGPGYTVLDGDPAQLPSRKNKGAQQPTTSSHVYCGQTAG